MPVPILQIPIADWAPDQPDYDAPGSSVITNVVPRTSRSYGPFPSLAVYSSALTARCQGMYAALDTSGNVHDFVGDATKLYHLVSGTTTWADVSRLAGGAYTIASDSMWRFTLMNGRIIATNYTDPPQGFLIDSASNFSLLSAGAPNARYVAVVKNFLVLACITDGVFGNQPQGLQWGGLNDPTNFPTLGTAAAAAVQSDSQNLYGDGGWIQGIVGNLGTADGAVFMEHAVWRMIYTGPPGIFAFLPAEGVRGTPCPNSVVQLGAIVYYVGEDGFYAFDGTNSKAIGVDRVDKFFFANVDQSNMHRVVGAVDPVNKIVVWAAPLAGSSGGTPNALMIYNWALDKWALVSATVETIGRALSFGYSLEGLDAVPIFAVSGSTGGIDAAGAPSLDSRIWTGGTVALCGFDTAHKMNYFSGASMAATLDTAEKQVPGKRLLITNVRPLIEGTSTTPSVAIGTRERQTDARVTGTAVAINSIGLSRQRVAGRFVNAQITIPAADQWTDCMGCEVEATEIGMR